MFLIGTVVLSELRKRERNPNVVEWVFCQRTTDLCLSVVSVGEIERGIVQQGNKNPKFSAELAAWLDKLHTLYGRRVLAIDLSTSRRWAASAPRLDTTGPIC